MLKDEGRTAREWHQQAPKHIRVLNIVTCSVKNGASNGLMKLGK
jgi:hypothetical protein